MTTWIKSSKAQWVPSLQTIPSHRNRLLKWTLNSLNETYQFTATQKHDLPKIHSFIFIECDNYILSTKSHCLKYIQLALNNDSKIILLYSKVSAEIFFFLKKCWCKKFYFSFTKCDNTMLNLWWWNSVHLFAYFIS